MVDLKQIDKGIAVTSAIIAIGVVGFGAFVGYGLFRWLT
jgi:hypothetical protein